MTKVQDSFKNAFDRSPFNERPAIRTEIMAELGIKSRVAFYKRMNGDVEHTRAEAMAIESVFKKRGITHIWG